MEIQKSGNPPVNLQRHPPEQAGETAGKYFGTLCQKLLPAKIHFGTFLAESGSVSTFHGCRGVCHMNETIDNAK